MMDDDDCGDIIYSVYIYIQSKLQNTILKEMGKENHRFLPQI
jgi:hypothetical protein